MTLNRVALDAVLAGRDALRYSPAGIPLLNAQLSHQSGQAEAGAQRAVALDIPAVFAGSLAESANALPLGSALRVIGFLAPKRRQSRLLSLHITEFELIEV